MLWPPIAPTAPDTSAELNTAEMVHTLIELICARFGVHRIWIEYCMEQLPSTGPLFLKYRTD